MLCKPWAGFLGDQYAWIFMKWSHCIYLLFLSLGDFDLRFLSLGDLDLDLRPFLGDLDRDRCFLSRLFERFRSLPCLSGRSGRWYIKYDFLVLFFLLKLQVLNLKTDWERAHWSFKICIRVSLRQPWKMWKMSVIFLNLHLHLSLSLSLYQRQRQMFYPKI